MASFKASTITSSPVTGQELTEPYTIKHTLATLPRPPSLLTEPYSPREEGSFQGTIGHIVTATFRFTVLGTEETIINEVALAKLPWLVISQQQPVKAVGLSHLKCKTVAPHPGANHPHTLRHRTAYSLLRIALAVLPANQTPRRTYI